MNELPAIYRAHLRAATAPDPNQLRQIWEPDGVLEFPYATSLGSPSRLAGISEIADYFGSLSLFGPFTFSVANAWATGDRTWLAELHGSSTKLADGSPYEQDYVVRFALSDRGRLGWMREYWDPTRA